MCGRGGGGGVWKGAGRKGGERGRREHRNRICKKERVIVRLIVAMQP